MNLSTYLHQLAALGSETDRQGMSRFGINAQKAWGIRIPALRAYARSLGKNASLAQTLWQSGYHEARMVAVFITPPSSLTRKWMESWVHDFDSWDLCDQACSLFAHHPEAVSLALEWSTRTELFQKRAGFAMMAYIDVHRQDLADEELIPFFSRIEGAVSDERNLVRKAINWAPRKTGKRSMILHSHAVGTAQNLMQKGNKAARWVAADALRELNAPERVAAIRQKDIKRSRAK